MGKLLQQALVPYLYHNKNPTTHDPIVEQTRKDTYSLKTKVKEKQFSYYEAKDICSTEPKADVSFSARNLTVVRRHRRCCCLRLCCCKPFIFLSSSPESQGQFQPNLAQNIPFGNPRLIPIS